MKPGIKINTCNMAATTKKQQMQVTIFNELSFTDIYIYIYTYMRKLIYIYIFHTHVRVYFYPTHSRTCIYNIYIQYW